MHDATSISNLKKQIKSKHPTTNIEVEPVFQENNSENTDNQNESLTEGIERPGSEMPFLTSEVRTESDTPEYTVTAVDIVVPEHKYAKNELKQTETNEVEITTDEVIGLYNLNRAIDEEFIQSYALAPDFYAIACSQEALYFYKKLSNKNIKYFYDSSISVGHFYISVLSYKHSSFTEGPVPLATIIHKTINFEVHANFLKFIKDKIITSQKTKNKNSLRCYGQASIVNAIEEFMSNNNVVVTKAITGKSKPAIEDAKCFISLINRCDMYNISMQIFALTLHQLDCYYRRELYKLCVKNGHLNGEGAQLKFPTMILSLNDLPHFFIRTERDTLGDTDESESDECSETNFAFAKFIIFQSRLRLDTLTQSFVISSNSDRQIVQLYPVQTCTCNDRECFHVTACQVSIGMY